MSVAAHDGNVPAMIWAIFSMIAMIVILDQLLWRPTIVWAQKFRVEESAGGEQATSWFLDWIRHSGLVGFVMSACKALVKRPQPSPKKNPDDLPDTSPHPIGKTMLAVLIGTLLFGAWILIRLLAPVSLFQWTEI